MITTADLSYDGKQVVFAWKRGGLVMCNPVAHIEDIDRSVERQQLPDLSPSTSTAAGLKQLTSGPHNNLDPCWLPDGGIAFISDRKPAYAYCYVVTSPVVYRMDRRRQNQKRLSANYLMDFTPSVLNDGRIIYTRWEYVDRAACPIQSLWAINPDGTGLPASTATASSRPARSWTPSRFPARTRSSPRPPTTTAPAAARSSLIDSVQGRQRREAVTNLTPEIERSITATAGSMATVCRPLRKALPAWATTSTPRLQRAAYCSCATSTPTPSRLLHPRRRDGLLLRSADPQPRSCRRS